MNTSKKRKEIPKIKNTMVEFAKATQEIQKKSCSFPFTPEQIYKWYTMLESTNHPNRAILRLNALALNMNQFMDAQAEIEHILAESKDASPSFCDMETLSIYFA